MTCTECVSAALVMQRAKRMRRVVLLFVACLALLNLPTLSRKLYDFRGNVIERNLCVLIFSAAFTRHVSHSKKN